MSRPKKFNDYSYGVGLEYNASSYKQVKDVMKSDMDALLKMARSYNEAIKIDPDVDISKMVAAFKELSTILDQTKKSGNPFSEFVDKGVLTRVSNLEQNLGALTKTSEELKKIVDSMFDGIKSVGKEKFSGSFDSIFGYKSKEIDEVTESIKKLSAEIDNLKKIPGATTGTFNRSTKEQKISKASVKEVDNWVEEYKKLADEVDTIDPSDFEKIGPALKRMRELGMSIKEALELPNIQKSKGFSEYQSFLKESARYFEKSVDDFNANIQERLRDLRQQRKALEDELITTQESAAKLSGQISTNKKQANKKSTASLGKLDQTVDVSVKPKVDVGVWSNTINQKLKSIQDKLEPVVLKATFSNKSKNLEKELDGNIAAINHTVKAEFNIEDNFGNENDPNSFFGKLRKLDTDLQEAKEKLSSKTQFKVRFAFESADGSVVTNVKSYVQNQFKNIPVTLHVKNGKSFMASITNMINGVKGNFEKSLTDIPVSFKIKNEEELLQSVYALKETIGSNMNDIGVNFVTNGIVNIGDAADVATKEVEELSASVEKMNDNSKKKSPSLAELFEEYDRLEAKLNSVYGNKEKLIATYGKGEKGFSAYEKDVKRFQQLERGLGTALEERAQAKELDRLSASATNAQKNIIKAKDALVDLNKNKFSSQFFIEIGYVQNGKSVGDPSGSLKKLVEEYDVLSKKISQESSSPGSVYSNNKAGRSQYAKDAARLTFLNKTLNDTLQNQIQLLSRKESINREILETTSRELSLQEKQDGSKADLAQGATKAEQKYAKLNETITKTEEILKDLSSSKSFLTNSDKTYQFTKLGEWDETTKKFKRNREEMKKLLEEYRSLHKANKAANITDENNPSLKREYELRQKINNIIKDQKKHLRESLREQKKQRDLAQKTIEAYKKAPTSESLSAKKTAAGADTTVASTKKSSKEIKALQKTIKEQEAVIADLTKKGRNSEYFTKLGTVDKSTKQFKKNTAEVTKMLARYKELAAMDKRTKAQDAEKNKLNGQLTQILIAQKKQATEILEKNKQDLVVLQQKQGTTGKTTKKSAASAKKATNKGVQSAASTTTAASGDRLGQLVEIANQILAEIKSPKSTAKTKNATKKTSEKTDVTPTNKRSNKKVLSLSQRLGKVTAQRDALPEGSAERAAIEERIKLIRKEIVEKQKSGKVDKALMLSAFNLGQEEQKISDKISQGRKKDTAATKQEINATKELILLYQKLGQLDEEISSKDGYEKIALEDERKRIQAQINAKQSATTESEIEAYVKAREEAMAKINKQFAKKEDKTEASNIRELISAYSNLGKLQANLDKTTGARARKELEDQIAKQKLLIQEKQKGISIDEDLLDAQRVIAYNKQIDKLRLAEAKRFDKAEEAAKKDAFKSVYGLQEVEKATRIKDNITGITLSDEFKGSSIIQNELTNISNAYGKLINKQKQFKDANPAQSEIEEFKMLEDQYDQAVLKLEKIIKSSRALEERALEGKITPVNPEDVSNIDKLKERLISAAIAFDGAGIKVENFDADLKQLDYSVKQQDGTWKNFSVQLNSAGTQIVGLAGKTKNVESIFKSFFSGSLDKFKNAIQVFSGYNLFFEGISKIRQGIQYVKEIDSALTELKKVTDETDESYAQFLQTMSQTGSEIGATVSDLTNMAANWARLGYSMKEAGNLARSTAVLLNVSEFTDAEKASEALISTIQAYGYAAEDSMHVVDVLNEIGNNFAISSDGIATALQDSASSLMAAGNNLEQSVAMIAAANKVLQDPNSVGSALRTISLRIRGTSVKVLEEMGEETDGVIESVSKLQAKIKGLTGVNILNDAGGYKDTYTIIKEIAAVWNELSDINKAATLELLAGKNRSNAMAAMLTNIEDLTAAYEDAMDAEGSAMSENEKYLDSIQGRIDQFTNALQTMWNNVLGSNIIKMIVSLGTQLIKLVDTLGLIPSILITISSFKLGKIFLPELWGTLKNAILANIAAITSEIATVEALNAALVKQTIEVSGLSIAKKQALLNTIMSTTAEGEETLSTEANTAAKLRNLIATSTLSAEEKAKLLTDLGLISSNGAVTISFKVLAASVWATVKAIGAFLLTNPVGWLILAATAIGVATVAIDKLVKTHEDYAKEIKDSSDKISEMKDNITNLNKELEETRDKIFDLEHADTLSFTEQAELDRLKKQNAELERSIALEERKKELEEKKRSTAYVNAAKTDTTLNGKTTVYKDENGNYVTASQAIQQSGTGYANRQKVLNDGYSEETVSVLEGKIAEEQRAKEAYEKAQKEYEDALNNDETSDKELKKLETRLNNTKETYDNASEDITNTLNELEETYGDIEWYPDAEAGSWQEKNNKVYKQVFDYFDQLAIKSDETGKAVENAFNRIAGMGQFDGQIKQIEETANITGKDLEKALNTYSSEEAQKLLSVDKEGLQDYIDLYDYYIGQVNEAQEKNVDLTKTVYGNIDLNNRQVLEWTEDTIAQYKDAIESWGLSVDDLGDISTVLGSSGEYEGIEIAFSPILQTENGPKLLDSNTVDEYIYGLIDKAKEQGKPITAEVLMELDATGLEFNGQQVKNLLAGVGDEARKIGESMHYLGADGSISGSFKAIEEAATQAGMSTEDFIAIISNVGESNDGLKQFIQSLIDCGVISDTSAESLQKVIDLTLQTSNNTSDAAAANQKLARSQKMLQYYKLYKELDQYTKKLKNTYDSTGKLTNQYKEQIALIRQKMASLAQEISKYDILSAKISEAKSSFEEFENAKTADSDSDYLDKTGEMFQSLISGFQSAEMGSETFKSAFTSLIPESVYADLDTLTEKYDAAAKYISETLNRYMKVEYDDDGLVKSVETTSKNIETFIEDAKKKGLMSFSDGVWTVNETDFDTFAEKMGITKEMLLAIGTQIDKMDADWIMGDITSFFDSFDMDAETNIYRAVQNLALLNQQMADGKVTAEEYAESYTKYNQVISDNSKQALSDIEKYTNATSKVDEITAQVEESKAKLEALKNSGASEADIQAETNNLTALITKLSEALAAKGELTKPSELVITVAQEYVTGQLDVLQAQLQTRKWFITPTIKDDGTIESDLFELGEDGKYKIKANITIPEEDKALVDEYVKALNDTKTLGVYLKDENDAQGKADKLQTTAENIDEVLNSLKATVDVSTAITELNRLKDEINSFKDIKINVTTEAKTSFIDKVKDIFGGKTSKTLPQRNTSNSRQNTQFVEGTANATGDWGLSQNEHNSLVGELGQELVVNPKTGKYYTVGDNGAELVDLPKDAIIFNHKQTEALFKNGHINSRGQAYINGNAHVGTSGTIFTKYGIAAAYGGTIPNYQGFSDVLQHLDTISNTVDDASSDSKDDFEELFDWFEVLINEIDQSINLITAKIENTVGASNKNALYQQVVELNYAKMAALNNGIELYSNKAQEFLNEIPQAYKEMAKNGAVALTDFQGEVNEKVLEAIKNYREWKDKAADLNVELENTKKNIADINVQMLEAISTEYENKIGLITNLNDRIQKAMDLQEESGERLSANYYNEMIKNAQEALSLQRQQRKEMQAQLDQSVASGDIERYSEDWYEMVNAINSVDEAIVQSEIDIESFQNAINDLHWENFERLIKNIENVSDEAEHLRNLIKDDDLTDDVGNWTEAGITALGLVSQEMENAKYRAELYGKEIEQLKKDYKAGLYSQDEYNDKLQELKASQWDCIDAYESAKDAIVDLNKTRIEAVKDGIQKEIDAYEKLINKRKEDLDAQKDQHDWAKTVKEHTSEIDSIQRQIDALNGDTSASAAAQRKKLQEELANAQQELEETYYDREIEMQQKALDETFELYKEDKEKKMEELDEYLKHEEQVIADSYELVLSNSEVVYTRLNEMAKEYNIEILNSVVDPWNQGTTALGTYGESLELATSGYVAQLKLIEDELTNIQNQADATARSLIAMANAQSSQIINSGTSSKPSSSGKTNTTTSKPSSATSGKPSVGQTVTVKSSATNWSRDGGNGTKIASFVKGNSYTVKQVSGNEVLIGTSNGYTGWINKKDLIGYAKGTTGVKKSGPAVIDENGLEEIVMHTKGGKVAYLTKGTSVLPHDISENLMQLGSVDYRALLERNKPKAGAPYITTNNIELNLNVGEVIHVEHMDNDSLPEIQDAIQKQLDSYIKRMNNGVKKYAR